MNYSQVIREQIQQGIIVCPKSHKKLKIVAKSLLSPEKKYSYHANHVPILITDSKLLKLYATQSKRMNFEYTSHVQKIKNNLFNKIRSYDYRTKHSLNAEQTITKNLNRNAVCVSIGGGPVRTHEQFINLNIGLFPNVDIVGDGHQLPYKNNSVDAVYSNAVFEHLHSPDLAAKEMFRVMKKGAKAYVSTPFMQSYHGYPNHYQNFTVSGHVKLFERQGFKVLDSGCCVGPTTAIRFLIAKYLLNYLPKPINYIARLFWEPISLLLGPLDLLLRNKDTAHMMASTTYVLLEK